MSVDSQRPEIDPLQAGAREVRWAPRVPLHKIRRLYETDAMGIVDDEQIDDVGYALLARCQSILEVTEAHDRGRLRCPRCRSTIQRHGRPDRPEDDAEVIRCGACGWATTAGAYRRTYRAKQLLGTNALPAFEIFVRDFQRAATLPQKMLAIDRLIHAIHGDLAQDFAGRPAGVNVLHGTIREIFTLLDGLAYGPSTSQGLLDGRAAFVSPELAERGLRADDLIKRLTGYVGGGGGGTPHEAFGGGGDGSLLEGALDDLRQAVPHALRVNAGPNTQGAHTP